MLPYPPYCRCTALGRKQLKLLTLRHVRLLPEAQACLLQLAQRHSQLQLQLVNCQPCPGALLPKVCGPPPASPSLCSCVHAMAASAAVQLLASVQQVATRTPSPDLWQSAASFQGLVRLHIGCAVSPMVRSRPCGRKDERPLQA